MSKKSKIAHRRVRRVRRRPQSHPQCARRCQFLTVADAGWAHAVGVVLLLGALPAGATAAVGAVLDEERR